MFGLGTKALWWILGTLATGVVIHAVTSPEKVVHLNPIEMSTTERFADDIFNCVEAPDAGELGFGYLAKVPLFVNNRIDAIREKVGVAPATMTSFPQSPLGAFAEASYKRLQDVSGALISAFKDADAYGEAASKFGVPYEEFKREAAKLVSGYGSEAQSTFLEKAAQFAPVANIIGTAMYQYATTGTADTTSAALQLGRLGAAALAGVVPVVGQVASLAISLAEADIARRKAGIAAVCQSFYDRYAKILTETTSEKFPTPMHMLTDAGAPCPPDSSSYDYNRILFLENAANANHQAFRALSVSDKEAVRTWWALTMTFMSHPLVFQAFSRLGHGTAIHNERALSLPFGRNDGAFYGGMTATDEQVVLVALPIAVANGLDPWDFAKALWSKSEGWRSADVGSRKVLARGLRWVRNDTGDPTDDIETYACPGTIANCWHLNWAALARDALMLAKTFPKAREKFVKPVLVTS